ncbi:hypothetical protein V496_07616 [Pseudogymnoascus sp. VKM F-4515 (FW-2607)]|nr:hypothetical protein V496_07616 [Pseudogymnoascus sp. VKM F-4515 (FW-2607)]
MTTTQEKTPEVMATDSASADTGDVKTAIPRVDSDQVNAISARKLLLKCDLRLVPILGTLYLVSFFDRSNIANARLFGLEKSLNMPSNGFNTCLWIFYIPFVIIEIPSNLIMSMNKIKPNYWLAGMMFILGVVSMCQGFTESYGGLLACRFLMGILEAGLPPGAALLIGQYYKRSEFNVRFAWFICFALGGSACGGLLAFALEHMGGLAGYESWRWVFIIEGLITVAFSVAAFVIIPGFPEDAKFLTEPERAFLLNRLREDRGEEKIDMKNVPWLRVLLDWKVWTFTVVFFCCDMSAASISAFTPTILKELGWTKSTAQVMSIPIWVVGIVFTLSASFLSGKLSIRYPFVFLGIALSLIGWAIQLAQVQRPGVRYFALFAIASGAFMQMPILIGWLNGNLRGRPAQAIGAAVQLGIGNCANFISSNVFITEEAPKYPTGFTAGLAITAVGGGMLIIVVLLMAWHNSKLTKAEEGGDVKDKHDQETFRDYEPDHFYTSTSSNGIRLRRQQRDLGGLPSARKTEERRIHYSGAKPLDLISQQGFVFLAPGAPLASATLLGHSCTGAGFGDGYWS